MVHTRYKSCVFPYSTRWCILAQNTWRPTCAFAVQTKQSVISFGFLFQRPLWRHCKTFNRNGGKRKPYSSTCSGIFYSGGPLRNQKSPRGHVQGLLLVHFDPFCFCLFWWKLSRYLITVGRIWQSKNTILFLYTTPNCTEEQRRIILLWSAIRGSEWRENVTIFWDSTGHRWCNCFLRPCLLSCLEMRIFWNQILHWLICLFAANQIREQHFSLEMNFPSTLKIK